MKKTILYFVIFCSICFEACGDSDKLIRNSANAPQCYIFELKNSEEHRVKLKKIRTSCTCADVKYLKSELQPGESTELIVTLKANSLSGPFTHTIYVETDTPKQRFMRFVIKGNVKVSPDPVQYIGTLQIGKKYEYKAKNKLCKCVSVDDIKSGIREFANSYKGSWSYPMEPNCHTFVSEALKNNCLEE